MQTSIETHAGAENAYIGKSDTGDVICAVTEFTVKSPSL
jgi:hypothetical protein